MTGAMIAAHRAQTHRPGSPTNPRLTTPVAQMHPVPDADQTLCPKCGWSGSVTKVDTTGQTATCPACDAGIAIE